MIGYSYEDTNWELEMPDETSDWLELFVHHHGFTVNELNYIFTSDEYLLYLNKKYLEHDEFTDILTFNYTLEHTQALISDIFISIDRVKENAREYDVPFIDELHRVMVHGLLHLIGFNDVTEDLKGIMRQQEDFALSLRMF